MMPIVHALLGFAIGMFRSRMGLQLEIVALRHRLAVYKRSRRQPPLRPTDRELGHGGNPHNSQSPWQNPFAERVIGSMRRECLDHVIVVSEGHLSRLLMSYVDYYHRWRTHLALTMDAPHGRPVQPPEQGAIVTVPEVGGLHHHYERPAA